MFCSIGPAECHRQPFVVRVHVCCHMPSVLSGEERLKCDNILLLARGETIAQVRVCCVECVVMLYVYVYVRGVSH